MMLLATFVKNLNMTRLELENIRDLLIAASLLYKDYPYQRYGAIDENGKQVNAENPKAKKWGSYSAVMAFSFEEQATLKGALALKNLASNMLVSIGVTTLSEKFNSACFDLAIELAEHAIEGFVDG